LQGKDPQYYTRSLLVGLLYFKAFAPEVVEKIRRSQLVWDDIASVLNPISPHDCPKGYESIGTAWYLCFSEELAPKLWTEYLGSDMTSLVNSFDHATPRSLLIRYADTFSLEGL
jgi:hypothetical protein